MRDSDFPNLLTWHIRERRASRLATSSRNFPQISLIGVDQSVFAFQYGVCIPGYLPTDPHQD